MTPRLLKILAVLVGLMSAVLCVCGIVLTAAAVIGVFTDGIRDETFPPLVVGMFISLTLSLTGGALLARAWQNFKSPDARSAHALIIAAVCITVMIGMLPLVNTRLSPVLPVIFLCYLASRHLKERVVPPSNGVH